MLEVLMEYRNASAISSGFPSRISNFRGVFVAFLGWDSGDVCV